MTHDNEEMVSFRGHEILLERLNAVVEDTEGPELGVSELERLVEEFEDEMLEAEMDLPELDIAIRKRRKISLPAILSISEATNRRTGQSPSPIAGCSSPG
ncbi:MAG: hypothetical protein GYB53_24805 [Rhodobacteraceae bacterium]|nr:hypothetical protein [Paracoccaceae bacterium]MBR9823804.1 hypothetical protein [Paracoccaceae bacterium]